MYIGLPVFCLQVSGSMPFDDTNVKRMIRHQLEHKYGFLRFQRLSEEVKDLINNILEAKVALRYTTTQIIASAWLRGALTSPPASITQPVKRPDVTVTGQKDHTVALDSGSMVEAIKRRPVSKETNALMTSRPKTKLLQREEVEANVMPRRSIARRK